MTAMSIPQLLADPTMPDTGLGNAALDMLQFGFKLPRVLFLILAVMWQSDTFSNDKSLFAVEFFLRPWSREQAH